MAAQFFQFFLGTPRRLLSTLAGLAILFGLFFPEIVGNAIRALLTAVFCAVAPFIQPVLVLMVVIIGLGVILRGVWRPRGGGR